MENPPHQPCNPLTDEHCDLLSNILVGCAYQDEILQKCQGAGLNVDKYIADNNRRKALAAGLKQQFFPHRP